MIRQFSIRTFLVMFLIFIPFYSTLSQVVVERSKDKVVISGVPYYLHLVKKGETSFSVSRAYGITTELLIKENPDASEGLKEGQSLRIPVAMVTVQTPSAASADQKKQRDESRFIYHMLQPGETIYSLSKKYGVSENEIVQNNPGIDITKMPLGYELLIPRKPGSDQNKTVSPVSQGQKQTLAVNIPGQKPSTGTAGQDTKDYFHKVLKGETLSSIAQKYGVSVRDLRRENRDIRFPQVGDYLKIPGMKIAEKNQTDIVVPDTAAVEKVEEELYLGRPSEYTVIGNLDGTVNLAVLLPFYLDENTRRREIDSSRIVRGKRTYTEINRPADWIYPGSLGFLEMYEGILLAADTLRSLGLNINIYVFDIRSDTVEITRLINSGKLDKMNLIIGPVHSRNLAIVATYAGKLGIPVVSPVQLFNNSVLVNNPLLFMANSSLEVAQNSIARKIREYYNQNIVFIHSDTSGIDPDVWRFKSRIRKDLDSIMPDGDAEFKELIFYSRSAFGTDSVLRLTRLLSDKKDNIIIIASEDAPVIIETIQDVYNASRKFSMKVFGYPEMRLLKNIDPKFYFDLGLMVYSPYWIDYSCQDVKQFCSDFMTKFNTQPPEMSYAWEGYDIAYYFLSGIAMHGEEFIRHPEIHNPDLVYTQFDFRRKSLNDGFENQKLFLVRYTNNYSLELVDDQED